MNRKKLLFSLAGFIGLALLGCAISDKSPPIPQPPNTKKVAFNYTIEEKDSFGTVLRYWHPVLGNLYVDKTTGYVTFKDSVTGAEMTITNQYNLIDDQ